MKLKLVKKSTKKAKKISYPLIPHIFSKSSSQIKLLEIEKLSLEADRIQNLTITVNKVRHVLDLIREKAKPKQQATSRFKKAKETHDEDISTQAEESIFILLLKEIIILTAVPSNARMSTRSSKNTTSRKTYTEFNEEVKTKRRTRGSKNVDDEDEDAEVVTKKTKTVVTKTTTKEVKFLPLEKFQGTNYY